RCCLLALFASPGCPGVASFPTRRSSDLLAGIARSDRRLRHARDDRDCVISCLCAERQRGCGCVVRVADQERKAATSALALGAERSEEHTSELQSRSDLVCRLLLEKKKK